MGAVAESLGGPLPCAVPAMPASSVLTGSALGMITACSGSLCQVVLGVTQPRH